MAYVFELADVLSSQLKRIASFNAYELAGQAANLDFWVDEALHACQVIDGYQNRYKRMSLAITQYISDHHTVCFDPSDPHWYKESYCLTPAPPAKFPTTSNRP